MFGQSELSGVEEFDSGISLTDVLNTPRGLQFFKPYCRGEFSEENPLAWEAIENFKKNPTNAALKDIYVKFVERGAPLEVNVPFRIRSAIRQMLEVEPETSAL